MKYKVISFFQQGSFTHDRAEKKLSLYTFRSFLLEFEHETHNRFPLAWRLSWCKIFRIHEIIRRPSFSLISSNICSSELVQ